MKTNEVNVSFTTYGSGREKGFKFEWKGKLKR